MLVDLVLPKLRVSWCFSPQRGGGDHLPSVLDLDGHRYGSRTCHVETQTSCYLLRNNWPPLFFGSILTYPGFPVDASLDVCPDWYPAPGPTPTAGPMEPTAGGLGGVEPRRPTAGQLSEVEVGLRAASVYPMETLKSSISTWLSMI